MSVIIRLQKLPLTANASDVRSFFKGLSIPDGGVHIVGGALGDAFIAFSTDEDARQAMALNGGRINNEPVVLLLSSRAEMQKVIDQARRAALSYMQQSRVAPVAAKESVADLPNGIGSLLLPKFNSPPPAVNATVGHANVGASKPQPLPPVISLEGFLAKAQSATVGNSSLLTAATAAVPTVPPTVQAASFSPLLPQGSYNEIPGLSFLSPTAGSVGAMAATATATATATADIGVPSALSTNNLSSWLSALNGQILNKGLNGIGASDRIDTSFLANSVTPVNVNVSQKDANSQGAWKFLKKDRRSRSPSRERGHKRDGRSRSVSRDRDLKRDRRSRSSSRGRSYRRNGRSRSSSRDRGSRSWSRDSGRDNSGRRRYRKSRSRSSSRDRFGRTRHRSRSRSPRTRRSRDSSHDRSREASGDRYDRDPRLGTRGRFSHFSGREANHQGNHQQQAPVFTGNAKQPYGGGMARDVEPIFGLHTQDSRLRQTPVGFRGGGNFFPTRSGKISPPPAANGASGGGGPFRNISPLPDSVYSAVPSCTAGSSNGATTSDFAIKMSNFEPITGYGEIRAFFKTPLIAAHGIKMINDQYGRRTGVAYVQFLRKEGKRAALLRDGSVLRRMCVRIESITDQEFEQAIDSYRPGSNKGGYHHQPYQQLQQQQQQQHQQQQQQQQQNQPSVWSGDSGKNNASPWSSNTGPSFPRGDGDTWDRQRGSGNLASGSESSEAYGQDGLRQKQSLTYAPTSALWVWNLPTFTTEQDIMKMFSDFTVVEVLIVKNHGIPKQLDGYVRFHRQEDAKEAWSQVHRHYIGNKKVTVRMCPEIDYAVAKNEYENPVDAEPTDGNSDGGGNSSQDRGESNADSEQRPDESSAVDEDDQDSANNHNNDGEQQQYQQQQQQQQQQQRDLDCNERIVERGDGNNGVPVAQEGRKPGGARKKRWDNEKNWDEEDDDARPSLQPSMSAQRQMVDSDGGAGSDTNASWVDRDRDSRMNSGDDQDSSQANDANHYGNRGGNNSNNNDNNNYNNNGMNARDRRRQRQDSPFGGRFGGGGNSADSSELFQRTTCLLLRNVDFNVYEEDVFKFFANDGFYAKSVLLVRNERGKRTGECLVEFESPGEAAHAESKSSQSLGRRKVFASHLDRGQVAELMQRFDAIAAGDRNRDDGRGDGQYDDPEASQGVGCGPYRTVTVGLLNLQYKTTVEDVQNFFREFNLPLENIRRRYLDNGQPTGEAMVRFRNHMDAEKALNEYQNRKLFGRNVRIRLINDD